MDESKPVLYMTISELPLNAVEGSKALRGLITDRVTQQNLHILAEALVRAWIEAEGIA